MNKRRKPLQSSAMVLFVIIAVVFTATGCSDTEMNTAGPAPEKAATAAFMQYYTHKAETDTNHDYSHMDLTVLEEMASSTAGTVIDTEDLSIVVLGALVSGNTAEIILRVTAKKLDSVLYDNGTEHLKNYRFGDEAAMLGIVTLGRQYLEISHVYSYSDADTGLAANQFDLHYWIRTPAPLKKGVFSIPLTDFGFYSTGSLSFVPLYTGTWNIDIAFDPAADNSKMIQPDTDILVSNYRFTIESIQITPLACTIQLACAEDEETTTGHMDEIIRACSNGREEISLIMEDGSALDGSQIDIGGSWTQEYPLNTNWVLSFNSPMPVESIVSLSLYDNDVSLID